MRIIGVCFGHQIVGRALGTKVGPNDEGWEVAVNGVDLTEQGKWLFGLEKLVCNFPNPILFSTAPCRFWHQDRSPVNRTQNFKRIQQMHRDIVFELPPNTIPLGSSPTCSVQGMYSPRRFISVQGHPEFTADIVNELLQTRKYMGMFPEGVYEGGMETHANEHDGLVVGKAFLEFALEE